jgi:hypothetical protein
VNNSSLIFQTTFRRLQPANMADTPITSQEGSSSRDSSVAGKVHTINSFGMGRLRGKNAIVTGAAG